MHLSPDEGAKIRVGMINITLKPVSNLTIRAFISPKSTSLPRKEAVTADTLYLYLTVFDSSLFTGVINMLTESYIMCHNRQEWSGIDAGATSDTEILHVFISSLARTTLKS